MSVWPETSPYRFLSSLEGELVSIRVTVEARLLERLLESLAELPYPINPQIVHHVGTVEAVQFPAYATWVGEIRKALASDGFPATALEIRGMLEELHPPGSMS